MEFERDPIKATQNLRKHKITFAEAAIVFGDFLGATFVDPDHSISGSVPSPLARRAGDACSS
jgi:uncharacterized DUF497 family protein